LTCLLILLIRIALLSSAFISLFNHPATSVISTLSLHDALPICEFSRRRAMKKTAVWLGVTLAAMTMIPPLRAQQAPPLDELKKTDRKSTRLNSSHGSISYAVFCLKKKNNIERQNIHI